MSTVNSYRRRRPASGFSIAASCSASVLLYEVTAVIGGRMIDNDLHLDRLERSLRELAIPLGLAQGDCRRPGGIDHPQCLAGRHGLSAGLARRGGSRLSRFRRTGAAVRRLHAGEDADRHQGPAGRHLGRSDRRSALAPSRHQDRHAARSGHGEAGGPRPRFRRRLAGGERTGDAGGRILHGPCHHR